ncbi:MAG: endonuclease domain-containing protein [Actinomycetota bacterium]|nr:endonuclease domain-containing protein [Actinomycetota bacterium]
MVERVEDWWGRRQFTHDDPVPYPVGTYREAWAPYPMLIRQYHPELNAGITLTQIPPVADVLLLWECEVGHQFAATPFEQRSRPRRERRRSSWCPECFADAKPRRVRPAGEQRKPAAPRTVCRRTPDVPIGNAFVSECAPKPASAVEARLRLDLETLLSTSWGLNAVRVKRPFFDHVEVWPDIVIPELRIAVEYDSPGRFGLEHVGPRELADRRKDRALRGAGWEVVRIRTGRLEKLGPYDLQLTTIGRRGTGRLLDTFRDIRGPLLVDAYLLGPRASCESPARPAAGLTDGAR